MGRRRSVLIVAGAFINLFLITGLLLSIGVFVVEWQEEFQVSAEEIGWISSFVLIGYAVAGNYGCVFLALKRNNLLLNFDAKFQHTMCKKKCKIVSSL